VIAESKENADRLVAPRFIWFQLAKAARHRGLVASAELDGLHVSAWDVESGQITPLDITTDGFFDSVWISAMGEGVYRLRDVGGNEMGHLTYTSIVGGREIDLTPNAPNYTLRGSDVSLDGSLVAVTQVSETGFTGAVLSAAGVASPTVELFHSPHEARNCRISAEASLFSIDTTDRNPGLRRYAVEVFHRWTREKVGVLPPSIRSHSLGAVRFSPLASDTRMLIAAADQDGWSRPLLWDVETGQTRELGPDLEEADQIPLDWSDDGRYVLICRIRRAGQRLFRYDLERDLAEEIDVAPGSYHVQYARTSQFGAGGAVVVGQETVGQPLSVLRWERGRTWRLLESPSVGRSASSTSVDFASSDGTRVQAWLTRPDSVPSRGAVVRCHGGPHVEACDEFSVAVEAYTDDGLAVLDVNYRGSSGRGSRFMEAVWGDVGHWELEDVAAAHRWLAENGIAHADRIAIAGGSYGGFLTLYALGRQPSLWAAGVADVAIADWAAAHADTGPATRKAFETWFGGPPSALPDLYAERSRSPTATSFGRRCSFGKRETIRALQPASSSPSRNGCVNAASNWSFAGSKEGTACQTPPPRALAVAKPRRSSCARSGARVEATRHGHLVRLETPEDSSTGWSAIRRCQQCPSSDGRAKEPILVRFDARRLEVDAGTAIFCETAGSGPSIVLSHDGILHRQTWDFQTKALTRSHRVTRWDRRGYGKSDPPTAPYSSVGDLARVIEQVAGAPATLVGCSYGGLLSLHCALDHPHLVTALVLVGPIVSGLALTDHFMTRGGRSVPDEDAPVDEQIAYWSKVDPWLTAAANTKARSTLRGLLVENPHNLRIAPGLQLRRERDALSQLAAITVPTLIIVGEHDIPDVHAHSGAIEAGISGARRVIVQGSGHLPHLEDPDQFNRLALEFLAGALAG